MLYFTNHDNGQRNAIYGIGPLNSTSKPLSRGSLPVVIVEKWEDVTKERLDLEWERIISKPASHWDWKRVFIDHWIERIKNS